MKTKVFAYKQNQKQVWSAEGKRMPITCLQVVPMVYVREIGDIDSSGKRIEVGLEIMKTKKLGYG